MVAIIRVRSFEPCSVSHHLEGPTKWSGWQELNLRGHVPKTCGWPLPYTRIWWLGTELNRIHWLFRPALCRRVPEPNFGGRCETRTRISRLQAVGNPLIRTAHFGARSEEHTSELQSPD